MRKLSLALAGAVALASASAANATITLVATNVDVTDSDLGGSVEYINYQKPHSATGSFSEYLTFYNDTAGVYNLSVLTQMAANVTFNTLTLSGAGVPGGFMTFNGPVANGTAWSYAISNLNLGVGQYTVNLAGSAPAHSTWQGTLNFSAVPEPATWGLMLLGFGLMGASMRRRRTRVALPQLA